MAVGAVPAPPPGDAGDSPSKGADRDRSRPSDAALGGALREVKRELKA